jgi:DNA repair photolyase
VKAVFEDRLRAAMPDRAERVLHRVRETREGDLYDARFGARQRGEGRMAEAIASLFTLTARRLGFEGASTPAGPSPFRRPPGASEQLPLL